MRLPLDSLLVEGFRAFEHLEIRDLGRVNLITGRNNVGKSCLLEALYLYARQGSPTAVFELLDARDEIDRFYTREEEEAERRALSVGNIFHGRPSIQDGAVPGIRIGPCGPPTHQLGLRIAWYAPRSREAGPREQPPILMEQFREAVDAAVAVEVTRGADETRFYPLATYFSRPYARPTEPLPHPCVFVRADGIAGSQLARLWDEIALTPFEEDALGALRIVSRDIERISLVGDRDIRPRRIPIAKVVGQANPIPLKSMGEGMNRMLGIALALANSQNGMLLVDEFESGLHYSVLPDIWHMVFRVASRLKVQVFATTHSWDCVEAFQEAAAGAREEKGILIRLQRRHDAAVEAEVFDERMLAIATKESIEVR